MSETEIAELTEEELKAAVTGKIQKFSELCQQMLTTSARSEEWDMLYFQVAMEYYSFMQYPVKYARQLDSEEGKVLATSGLCGLMCDIAVEDFTQQEDAVTLGALCNFSDCSAEVTFIITEHPTFLPTALKRMDELVEPFQAGTLSDSQEDMLDITTTVIHNVAMRQRNVPRLQELNATKSLLPYLQSENAEMKLKAYATLADVVTEKEANKLSTSRELAGFLLKTLRRAFKSKEHRYSIWSTTELVRAVRQLARNDANKRLLVQEGVLPLLTSGGKSKLDDEKADCMEALWVLSFDKDNQTDILKDDKLLSLLNATHDDKSLPKDYRSSAKGLLFQLRDGLIQHRKYKSLGEKFCRKELSKKEDKKAKEAKHVMLSYQWDDQDCVKKIRDCLVAQDVKVWMDIDDMSGSIVDAMAAAVENSFMVLMCSSQRYKDSPNCRAEADYAFKLQKNIVPLIMQKSYVADGWLGLIQGAKLFYDFSSKYPFQSRMDQLVKHVRETQGQLTSQTTSTVVKTVAAPVRAPPAAAGRSEVDGPRPRSAVRVKLPAIGVQQPTESTPAVDVKKVKSWGQQDVKTWLQKFGLNGAHFEKLRGNDVIFLRRLRGEAPEMFYKMLEKNLLISILSDFTNFTEALDSLPTV